MHASPANKKRSTTGSKSSRGTAAPVASESINSSGARSRLGAFYSYGATAGFSPALQAKMSNNDMDMSEDQDQSADNKDVMLKSESTTSEPAADEENQEQPSALQTKAASSQMPLQLMCAECEKEQEDEAAPVQEKSEDTGSEIEQAEEEDTQLKEETNTEVEEDETAPTDSAVQMWDCNDYDKPTCQIQTKDESASAEQTETEEDSDAGLVQTKCSACETEEQEVQTKSVQNKTPRGRPTKKDKRTSSVHRVAEQGLANANHPLPHRERIQESFGRHDISGVRAEVGGDAGRATKKLGALAYTSGDKIGFRHTPDIKLAAHEAAHTVQQRAGLKLPGNRGTPGDRWERHADDVADAVATGKSAEPLLDSVAPVSQSASQNALSAGQVPNSSPVVAGGEAAPPVQNKITSSATHQTEPKASEEKAGGGAAEPEAAGEEAAETGEAENQGGENTEEAAEAKEQNEPDPAADCEAAQGDDAEQAEPEQQEGAASGGEQEVEQPPGPAEKGRCYVEDSPDPPEGAEEPEGDTPPNESEAEADVTYGEWEEANDECDCRAEETMPANAAEKEVTTAVPAELSTPDTAQSGTEAQTTASGGGGEAPAAGASGGAGGGGAEESPEGNFAQGEASRDAAVAEFDAATTEVNRVPERARKLSQGLRFSAPPAGNAAEAARRAMALKQISAFMQNAAAQIEGAVSFVRDQAPARLGAMAEAVKANIEASMIAEKSAISARINQSRAAAMAEAEAARNTINSDYEASVASVNAETDIAVQTLNDVHTASTDAIAAQEESALAEVNRRFQAGRDDHDAKGTTFANAAVATGQEWADAYDDCRAGPGNEYERNGDDGFWDGCLTVRRAKAQQDAACNTAGGMAKNMVDMAKEKGFKLREQRTQHRCSVIAGATESQTTLDSTLEGLIAGLESGRASTLDGLTQARDANLSGVDSSLEARFQSLDRQEREQRQAVNDSGYVQQVAVEQMAHQVAAGLVNSVSAAMESLEQKLGDLREQLLKGDVPSDEQLAEVLSTAGQGMGEGVGSLMEKMEEGASTAEMSLLESGQIAATALADITTGNATLSAESDQGFTSELSTLVSAASDSMAQLADSHIANAQESMATGTESMDQVVMGFIETTERIYTQADEVISTSLGELDTELTNMANGLESKIAAEAWRAASKEQPAWKGVVAIVLIIVIIIASIVVTVLTAGAAAAALGPILGAAVLGAVVGAASAALIQMVNNWAAGEELTKGLVQAIVMGAVGGAIGGAIGAGANGLAQVGVNAAIRAGSSTLTRAAINVGVNLAGDMVAEGATQAFGYFAYGQQFNWQGFATAGLMSAASTARGAGGAAGKLDADASLSSMFRRAGAAGPRPTLRAPTAGDAAIGLGVVAAVEGASFLATGEFDANRLATSAAGSIAGISAAGLGRRQAGGGGDVSTPRPTTPDVDVPSTPRPTAPEAGAPSTPRPAAPDVDTPAAPRPVAPEADTPATPRPTEPDTPDVPRRPTDSDVEGPSTRRPDADDTDVPRSRSSHEDAPEIEPGVVARRDLGDGHAVTVLKDGRIIVCSICDDIRLKYDLELSDPRFSAYKTELDRISGISDPNVKAEAAAQLRNNLETLRGSGVSRAAPELFDQAGRLNRPAEKPIPPGGRSVEQHLLENPNASPRSRVRENPQDYYVTQDGNYALRPSRILDPVTGEPVPLGRARRPIPNLDPNEPQPPRPPLLDKHGVPVDPRQRPRGQLFDAKGNPVRPADSPNRMPVGEVDTYGNQLKVTGDSTVHRDHQPAKAALLRRAEELKGAPLTPEERTAVINGGRSVTVPEEVHRAGPTYGQNDPAFIAKDAGDLQAAAVRDADAMVANARAQGLPSHEISALEVAANQIKQMTNAQYDAMLRGILGIP